MQTVWRQPLSKCDATVADSSHCLLLRSYSIVTHGTNSTHARLHAALLSHPPALSPLQAKEIADTLSRSRNVTYLPSGGGQSLLLSVGQAAAA